MAVGFAAFSQQLQINSTSEVTSSWDIEITNIQGANPNGGNAYDVTPPAYTPTTATFSTGLVSPVRLDQNYNIVSGSFRVYQVEVSNLGTLTGQVSVASLSCGNNPAIQCRAVGADDKFIDNNGEWVDDWPENGINIYEGQNTYNDIEFTLEPTEKHYIEIYVWYSEDVETQPASLTADISLTLTYVQAESSSGGNSGSGVGDNPSQSELVIDQTYVPQYYEIHEGYNVSVGSAADTTNWNTSRSERGSINLGHDVLSGNVSANYVCYDVGNTQYCLKSSTDGSTFATNKALLESLRDAGKISCSTFSNSEVECGFWRAYSNGSVYIGDEFFSCSANYDGNSYCELILVDPGVL